MRRIVLFAMTTLTIVVLLFGYHTSTSSKAAGGDTAFIAPATTAGGSASPTTTVTASSTAAGTTGVSGRSTVTGDVAQTRWGPVQVQLTVVDKKITDVSVIQYPDNNGRDQEINADALPVLVQETISAQSAKIDMVTGATVTSDGYLSSLQSALDQAKL